MGISLVTADQPKPVYASQAPSMAMMVIKIAEPKEGKLSYGSESFGKLLCESISGFGEGRLPGDLEDTPEALATGRGANRQQSCRSLTEILASGAARDVCQHACT